MMHASEDPRNLGEYVSLRNIHGILDQSQMMPVRKTNALSSHSSAQLVRAAGKRQCVVDLRNSQFNSQAVENADELDWADENDLDVRI